ncbi:hypothetical protein RPMA_09660 [Tardiphaga alba]|uniref:Uncharacterized protein n=1 Tax=Tardiphaga alba TaxID=340268 RepID=A0ABX8A9K0_9BRAD|nr:hypothetical protein [Tardiphaga alba]QUS39070.1 hypothetical protein RPMA_09660 [Tardiphaga alba]
MDIVSIVAATIITFIGGVFAHVLAHDFCAISPRLCRRLIDSAVSKLPEHERERYREEWISHLEDTHSIVAQYQHAAGCLIGARKLRRQLSILTFRVTVLAGTNGSIPINVEYCANSYMANTGSKLLAKAHLIALILYYMGKFFYTAWCLLPPGGFKRLSDDLKNGNFDYNVHILFSRDRKLNLTRLVKYIALPTTTAADISRVLDNIMKILQGAEKDLAEHKSSEEHVL